MSEGITVVADVAGLGRVDGVVFADADVLAGMPFCACKCLGEFLMCVSVDDAGGFWLLTSLLEDYVSRHHVFRRRLFGTETSSGRVFGAICSTLSCVRGVPDEIRGGG